MAHGEASRPIESVDGSPVEITTGRPSSSAQALVVRTITDPEVKELLLAILQTLEKIRDK